MEKDYSLSAFFDESSCLGITIPKQGSPPSSPVYNKRVADTSLENPVDKKQETSDVPDTKPEDLPSSGSEYNKRSADTSLENPVDKKQKPSDVPDTTPEDLPSSSSRKGTSGKQKNQSSDSKKDSSGKQKKQSSGSETDANGFLSKKRKARMVKLKDKGEIAIAYNDLNLFFQKLKGDMDNLRDLGKKTIKIDRNKLSGWQTKFEGLFDVLGDIKRSRDVIPCKKSLEMVKEIVLELCASNIRCKGLVKLAYDALGNAIRNGSSQVQSLLYAIERTKNDIDIPDEDIANLHQLAQNMDDLIMEFNFNREEHYRDLFASNKEASGDEESGDEEEQEE